MLLGTDVSHLLVPDVSKAIFSEFFECEFLRWYLGVEASGGKGETERSCITCEVFCSAMFFILLSSGTTKASANGSMTIKR